MGFVSLTDGVGTGNDQNFCLFVSLTDGVGTGNDQKWVLFH